MINYFPFREKAFIISKNRDRGGEQLVTLMWVGFFISLIVAGTGITLLITHLMDWRGATIILLVGLIPGIFFTAQLNHQNNVRMEQAQQKELRKAQARKKQRTQMFTKAPAKTQRPVANRQLTAAQYALGPTNIKRMYKPEAQAFFESQYPKTKDQEYALKMFGRKFPGLVFHTTNNMTARLDNLKGENKRVVLVFLSVADSSTPSMLNTTAGLKMQFPNVHFITIFPIDDTNAVNKLLEENNIKDYDLLVTADRNPNVGNNYGDLRNFSIKLMQIQDIPTLVSIDHNSRVSMVFPNSSVSTDALSRYINLSFNSTDDKKIYNQLKSPQEIANIQKQPNQAYVQGATNED